MARSRLNRPLVVFGEDWGAHPSSTQHLMKRLALSRQIIWVNSIGLRRPRLTHHDIVRATAKLSKMLAPVSQGVSRQNHIPENITVVQPQAVCWPGNPLAAQINAYLLPRCLRPAISKLPSAPILWTSLPTAIDAVGRLGENSLVYYAGDDFSGLAGVDHHAVAQQERKLVDHADLVLGASEVVASRLGPSTIVLPHGYDRTLFATDAKPAMDLPMDGPVAGFYGSLSEWVDLELIANTADALPHWTFVLIGPVRSDVSMLKSRSNIRLLGPRDHDALPSYSQHWTASLLPFRDNRQIRACNPLKLREYLAAGRPVLSTPFPALGPYRHVVDIIRGPTELAAALNRTLIESCNNKTERRAAVNQESWETRAEYLNNLLDELPNQSNAA